MLKQKNGEPMSVGAQVASIYAVNGGYTDELAVKTLMILRCICKMHFTLIIQI